MAADRLPSEVREFAHYLDGLLARLDPSGGWCAVFWQRDPEGMRACLDGREMPPWDVVEALLQDLAGQYGPGGAGPETERARSLHAAALAAYDARPGGRDALGDRLDVMLREQKYAAERQTELTRLLATAATREEADTLRLDLAWAHDDHERATARCAELRARMADLDRREGVSRGVWGDGRVGDTSGAPAGASSGPDATPGELDDGAWSGAWRPRPNDGGARASQAGSAGWAGSGAAADVASGAGSGRSPGPGAAGDGASGAGSARWAGAGAAADGGRPVRADGYTPAGPAPDSRRMRSAPGGPYDPGTSDTPWHPEAPAPGATGAAGHDGPRHTDAGAAPARRPDTQDGEFAAGRAASREAVSGGASGPFAAPPGRADGWEDGEFAAGRAASREAASGGASGPFAAPPGRADGWEDGEFAAGRAASREAASDGAPGVFAAPGRGGDGRDGGHPGDGAGTPEPRTPKQRKRRRGSARFAGMVEEDAAPVVVPPAAVPVLPEPAPVTGRRKPRGARFAGAADEEVGEERTEPRVAAVGVAERRDVVQAVEALARLRKEGRSGEAHALLVEAASWAPARFPLLAHELERAGLGADWQTLLWEAGSLPAGRLVAAADALGAAGRAGDGQQILRQGVGRPPGEIGEAVLGLVAEGRHREVRVLLAAYVTARTPEEAARSAEPGPQTLVPLLLEAARGVSDERRRDLVHALRVAGFPA
ncbi:hypothetical protein ACH4E5_06280 [Streptomyces afghaniensis]|uniref:hypothetical protein n=1 Tax=Streptomyces afghaniensis TaxID=66865 RepID=UPI00378DDC47